MIGQREEKEYHGGSSSRHYKYWVKLQDYIHALQLERHKIQLFQRELPLCLQLITQAIESYKKQLSGLCGQGPSEFFPIKTSSSSSFHHDDEEDDESPRSTDFIGIESYQHQKSSSNKKLDWLKSAHLSLDNNQTPDPPILIPQQQPSNSTGGLEKNNLPPLLVNDKTKARAAGGSLPKEVDKDDQPTKTRRCWSPDLHKRFLDALQNLGGPHVATPKQIREVMKVDGLTNDEVKSHLQKYRLHTRRPIPVTNHSNNNTQQPQFVVVGGIWVPSAKTELVEAMSSAADGICAPLPEMHASISSYKAPSHNFRQCDGSSSPATTTTTSTSYPNKDQISTTLLLG